MKLNIPRKSMTNKIIQTIEKKNGDLCASDLVRLLRLKNSSAIRMLITGYLRCLEEQGILERRRIGSAITYSLKNGVKIKNMEVVSWRSKLIQKK